jgi:hypothetical protein
MQTKYYLPDADKARSIWLSSFYTELAALAEAWGIDAAVLLWVLNDSKAFAYELLMLEAAEKFAKACTANKDELRNGPASITALAFPVFTPPAGAPTPVPPGIFARIQLLVGQLKKNAKYTVAIGVLLGIIGEDVVVNFEKARPDLKLVHTGGLIHISYALNHTHGLYLFSMRGTETTFTLLATITKPSFNDARANLVVGVAEKRQYMGLYMVDDVQVGLESAIVYITI